jgi:DNA polymerase-1
MAHVFPSVEQALQAVSTNEDREYLKSLRYLRGDGDPNPDLILVQDFPNWADAKAGRVFMGDDGVAIRQAMLDLGIKPYFTSAFPFFPGSGKPKLADLRRAQEIIELELESLKPLTNKVILMGANAANVVPQFQAEYRKYSDLLHRHFEFNGFEFRAVPHPVQVAASPQFYREFRETARKFHYGITAEQVRPESPVPELYAVHKTRKEALAALSALERVDRVAVDLETTGLDYRTDEILTIQLSWREGRGHAFPWTVLTPDEWAERLHGKTLIFQNGTFDVKFLAHKGVWVSVGEDTMLMHSLIDETKGTHNMEGMSRRYLGIDKWSDMVDYDNIEMESLNTLGEYGARDADITLRLANIFRPLVQDRHINTVLHQAQNAIIRAELKGVKVDRELAQEMQTDIEAALATRQDAMADVHGLENANSPQQVARVLYEELGLPIQKKSGRVTTDESALLTLAEMHSLPAEILEYRHLTKASGTYLRKILEASELDGRYHGKLKLAATETGRLTEELLLLLPRPDNVSGADLGKRYQYRLRELFIPDEGNVMVGADYSALEVSMAAHLTGDRQLIQDIHNRVDTHSVVAIQAFNLPVELEPYDTLKKRTQAEYAYQRELAKRGTFTWLYGGGAAALAQNVGTDLATARQILETLRNRYPGVARWQDAVRASVQRDGNVSTPWGRTRRFFFSNGLHRRVIEEQLREAINSPNQGMSSDINLAAFAALDARGFDMLFPMHDAIYLQVPESGVDGAVKQIRAVMENVITSPVDFRADIKAGYTWAHLG